MNKNFDKAQGGRYKDADLLELDVKDGLGIKALLHPKIADIVNFRKPVGIFKTSHGRFAVGLEDNEVYAEAVEASAKALNEPSAMDANASLIAVLPTQYPEWLGGRYFTAAHNCRFPYVVGAMARGITTARMVVAASKHGLLGFFGAAGLRPPVIAEALDEIKAGVDAGAPWGSNLIHAPDRPEREREVVDLYLDHGVSRVSASAFMKLSPEIVRYAANGLTLNTNGEIERSNHVFAKVSRPEVAAQFMAPPPTDILRELAAAGRITELQAELQSRLPVAEDISVEADSGGHTDNRPLQALFPAIAALRNSLIEKHAFDRPIRLGAGGGLGTPEAVASAFQMGADYVLTGSVNQACVESGLSESGKQLLADCDLADVMMAPAADMFERGVKVQVLKKGSMFPVKAQRLYEIYRRYDAFGDLPEKDQQWLERQIFLESFSQAWARTRAHYADSNPALAEMADTNPKQQLALVFRRYLFMGAQWAREGNEDRRIDYQIWCGPAMGSFNDWVRGSFLEPMENRTVGQVALNLLEGACVVTRMHQLRAAGVEMPSALLTFSPRRLTLIR